VQPRIVCINRHRCRSVTVVFDVSCLVGWFACRRYDCVDRVAAMDMTAVRAVHMASLTFLLVRFVGFSRLLCSMFFRLYPLSPLLNRVMAGAASSVSVLAAGCVCRLLVVIAVGWLAATLSLQARRLFLCSPGHFLVHSATPSSARLPHRLPPLLP